MRLTKEEIVEMIWVLDMYLDGNDPPKIKQDIKLITKLSRELHRRGHKNLISESYLETEKVRK